MSDMNTETPENLHPIDPAQRPDLPAQPLQPSLQGLPPSQPQAPGVSGVYSGYPGQNAPTIASGSYPTFTPPSTPFVVSGMAPGTPGASGSYPPPAPGFAPYGPPPVPPATPGRPKLKPWQWAVVVVGILALCCVCGGISTALSNAGGSSSGNSSSQVNHHGASHTPSATNTPAPTPTPTHVPQWTVVQSFSGNGNKQTGTFNTPDDWRLVWTCDPSSDYFGSYNLIVDVDYSDGTPLDIGAINTICQQGNTSDYTEEHSGGDVYLSVVSEAAWTLQVQVLK